MEYILLLIFAAQPVKELEFRDYGSCAKALSMLRGDLDSVNGKLRTPATALHVAYCLPRSVKAMEAVPAGYRP